MGQLLFDLTRRAYSTEKDVTEHFVTPLLALLGYSSTGEEIRREYRLTTPYYKLGTQRRKYIVPDYLVTIDGRTAFVLDAKSPRVNIAKREYIQQIHSYASHKEVQASFFILSNALETVAYRTTSTAFVPLFSFPLAELPQREEELFERLSRQSVLDAIRIQDYMARRIRDLRMRSPDVLVREGGRGILETRLLGFEAKDGKLDPHPETIRSALRSHDPIIVFGNGGQGKTILATQIAERFLANTLGDASANYAPVILNCTDLNELANRNRDAYGEARLESLLREKASVHRLPGTLLSEHIFVFILDDYQKLSPDYTNAMNKAAQELRREENVIIFLSRLERTDIHPPHTPGYKILQIDTDAIAKDEDKFVEGRVAAADVARCRQYMAQYDSSVTGYYLTKLFLTMLFQANRQDGGVVRYVIDPKVAHHIEQGTSLNVGELYEAQTDYVTGCDIERRYPEWGINEVRAEIQRRKRQLDAKAVADLNGPFGANYDGACSLESSLVCIRADGCEQFVHDTYRDFFVARWYANKLNQPSASVAEVYKSHWSYVENKKLWHLECFPDDDFRGVLPAWEQVLIMLGPLLHVPMLVKYLEELVKPYFLLKGLYPNEAGDRVVLPPLMGPSYSQCQDYNPFIHNFRLAGKVVHATGGHTASQEMTEIAKRLIVEANGMKYVLEKEEYIKGVYVGLGYHASIVDFIMSHGSFFGIDLSAPDEAVGIMDSIGSADEFVKAAARKVFEKPGLLEDHGGSLCAALRSIGTSSAIWLLRVLRRRFRSAKGVGEYFSWENRRKSPERVIRDGGGYEERKRRLLMAVEQGDQDATNELKELEEAWDPDVVELLEVICSDHPRLRAQALRTLLRIAGKRGEDEIEDRGEAKRSVLALLKKYPDCMAELRGDVLKTLKQCDRYEDAPTLLALFGVFRQRCAPYEINDFYVWSQILAATGNPLVVPPLCELLDSGVSHVAEGLKAIPHVAGFHAMVRYIKRKRERYWYVIQDLGEMPGAKRFEEVEKTGIVDVVIGYCRKDHSLFDYTREFFANLGDEKAIEVILEYFQEVDGESQGHFESVMQDGGALVDALYAVGPLCESVRERGGSIPPELFSVVARFVVKESKLIEWHDTALRGIDPIRYIEFAQRYIPQNYGSLGIAPLYKAIEQAHDRMKPRGYIPQGGTLTY